MTLQDIICNLDNLDDSYVIVAVGRPCWTPESEAMLVWVDQYDDPNHREPIKDYFLEVFVAKEVLEVWSEWRGGKSPTPDERCEAVIYYAKHDAYLPTTEMGQ